MKKLLVTLLGFACALALTVNAAEKKKDQKLTENQKKEQKELLEKYDSNKDGKIDKGERAKMTKEDKEKWGKLSGHKKDESKDKDKKDEPKK